MTKRVDIDELRRLTLAANAEWEIDKSLPPTECYDTTARCAASAAWEQSGLLLLDELEAARATIAMLRKAFLTPWPSGGFVCMLCSHWFDEVEKHGNGCLAAPEEDEKTPPPDDRQRG